MAKATRLYSVVVFHTTNGEEVVDVVPETWLIRERKEVRCLWPTHLTNKETGAAVRRYEEPNSGYEECAVKRIIGASTPYERAQRKCKEATLKSDVENSELETAKRTRRPTEKKTARMKDSQGGESCEFSSSQDGQEPQKTELQSKYPDAHQGCSDTSS